MLGNEDEDALAGVHGIRSAPRPQHQEPWHAHGAGRLLPPQRRRRGLLQRQPPPPITRSVEGRVDQWCVWQQGPRQGPSQLTLMPEGCGYSSRSTSGPRQRPIRANHNWANGPVSNARNCDPGRAARGQGWQVDACHCGDQTTSGKLTPPCAAAAARIAAAARCAAAVAPRRCRRRRSCRQTGAAACGAAKNRPRPCRTIGARSPAG
jgi:hypothetical protein